MSRKLIVCSMAFFLIIADIVWFLILRKKRRSFSMNGQRLFQWAIAEPVFPISAFFLMRFRFSNMFYIMCYAIVLVFGLITVSVDEISWPELYEKPKEIDEKGEKYSKVISFSLVLCNAMYLFSLPLTLPGGK